MNKKNAVLILIVTAFIGTIALITRTTAADSGSFQTFEYATIRWGGRENTQLIRPSGQVESLGPLLSHLKRPDRVDERTYFMSVAVNAVAREGFELTAMTSDTFVMRRPVAR